MNKSDCIYVAGHRGMVGSAIIRLLVKEGYSNIITRTHSELDLIRQEEVEDFFSENKIDYVFLSAARVGGIMANSTHKAEFYYQNAMIAQNVIHSSWKNNVKKLMNLGSSCIYPKLAEQPLREVSLLTGALEETNDAYAIAKISAIKMCRYYNEQYGTNYLSVMPTNLFGESDNYDLNSSHVLPAMIRKFHEAKINNSTVQLWGDGSPLREFLYADDLAEAVVFLMENKDADEIGEFVNIGTGKDCSIKELSEMIADIVGFNGNVEWDTLKPNGTPRKLLDVSVLEELGWTASTSLKQGIQKAYNWYLENKA
ncbi:MULTISPECIES: GDP-L-fucose synthase [unclassified Oceanispirochaeta]|uniref:GDP-L-fucose synthase family protein n=1 Tax=unclassified Oceanispirochaeta TaxID=2635722 RepID=UPI000E09AEE5|nr:MULTISPECIES: GDP-L-fucose synthase [unclassified Oceanispirochaeta]MBF9017757.1 GDP-L-fucose synthase [Oceanispirochaeta sp. M2]NPD74321.1 GDP-L-fucose synthase [Oceanispirochaeta sp. M1]RDG29801.1 GDP-L-fucose synthase [Oceanispirochaeta sp. M1]